MKIIEIVIGSLIILTSILVILICLVQDKRQQGMTSAVTGASNDSFYGQNSKNTREAKLVRTTKVLGALFFVLTIVATVLPLVFPDLP